MCVYVCIYTCIYMHKYICMYIHVYIHICMYIDTVWYIYVYDDFGVITQRHQCPAEKKFFFSFFFIC
jgi:hypothetical protein